MYVVWRLRGSLSLRGAMVLLPLLAYAKRVLLFHPLPYICMYVASTIQFA